MTRLMITALGGTTGFIQGVVLFMIVNFSFDAPGQLFVSGVWLDYPPLIFGGLGAIGGAVVGWAGYAWMKKHATYVSVPGRPARVGALPNKGPFG